MFSPCDRNALLCSLRHEFSLADIFHAHFNANLVKERCLRCRPISDEDPVAVSILMELTFIRDGIFIAPELSTTDIDEFSTAVASMSHH